MPEPPIYPKRKPQQPTGVANDQVARTRYAELHCKTNFTFLEGASHPDELVARAVDLGYTALAITDRNSLAGVVRAHAAAKETGLKLLIGAEITPIDGPPVVLLATDRAAYGRLCRLLTVGRRRAPKGECELRVDDLAAHAEGLIALAALQPPHPNPLPHRGRGDKRKSSTGNERSGGIGLSPVSSSSLPGGIGLSPMASPSFPGGTGVSPVSSSSLGRVATQPDADPPSLFPGGERGLAVYREIFGDRAYLLAELHHGTADTRRLAEFIELSRRCSLPLVAAGDVHYHVPERMPLQHVLTAIRHGETVASLAERLLPNAERHLRSLEVVAEIFARVPDAVRRTIEVAGRCTFSLDELRYEYPEELAPEGTTPMQYLRSLAWDGANRRYGQQVPEKVSELLRHELELIEELHYEAYFLTVYDLVQFARSRKILCQGRGSAANSAVCFCLGVTEVDPREFDLLFERFVSRERNEAPDIDVDFEHERREEVLQYIYDKYGRERAGMTAEVITYRPRSAIRDVGKALGLSLDRIDALAKNVDFRIEHVLFAQRCRQSGIDPASRLGQQLVILVNELLGFPRHLSQHVGGMVITQGALCELSPIENAAMEGRTVIQWDKDDLDELGILKVDCLCLGMLTAIRKCFDLIAHHGGERLALADFANSDDPKVYEMICRADTIGVFQIESRAQMSMLPRLRPQRFYDLVIEVAIVRPGPIQGEMVHPYLKRRALRQEEQERELAEACPDERLKRVLRRTLGVPLFQEQAMQLAVEAAGFTPGEADQLRRAMAGWRRPGMIDSFHQKLIDGMQQKGYPEEFAERLFKQIRGFGEYGFPESHAASFAKLAYVSSWLKCYHPAAFAAALVNSQPMGFYAPAQLIGDARNHGVAILPIDVNYSDWDCTLEESDLSGAAGESSEGWVATQPTSTAPPHPNPLPQGGRGDKIFSPGGTGVSPVSSLSAAAVANPSGRYSPGSAHKPLAIRLGMRLVRGLREAAARAIVAARTSPFRSISDLVARAQLDRATVERLARADAFGSLNLDRRSALWQALDQASRPEELPLLDAVSRDDAQVPTLPKLTQQEEVFADYHAAGVSLRKHPVAFFRQELEKLGITPAADLQDYPNNRPVKVAGIVLMRQRPSTAKGITFVTIEDETGVANLIIHPRVWTRYDLIARRAGALIAQGKLERQYEVIHVVVNHLEDLAKHTGKLEHRCRDFR